METDTQTLGTTQVKQSPQIWVNLNLSPAQQKLYVVSFHKAGIYGLADPHLTLKSTNSLECI